MKIAASATVATVITSIASMAAAQSAALPPAASPPPAPESQPATAPASPPAWTYAPPPSPAAPPEFGDPGEYVISSAFFASFGHLGYTKSGGSTTSLSLQPSLDYFVGKNVLIGGALYFSYSDSSDAFNMDTITTGWGAYAHVGGNVTVGPMVSWRPVLSLGFRSETSKFTADSQMTFVFPERNEKLVVVQVFAPFLIHPARHFFLGIGPDFFIDVLHTYSATENNRTFVGVSSIVGGWFGGERDPSPP